jgi:hypothetical protein
MPRLGTKPAVQLGWVLRKEWELWIWLFPSGALLSEDKKNLLLFSGAADEVVTRLTIPVQTILQHLQEG